MYASTMQTYARSTTFLTMRSIGLSQNSLSIDSVLSNFSDLCDEMIIKVTVRCSRTQILLSHNRLHSNM